MDQTADIQISSLSAQLTGYPIAEGLSLLAANHPGRVCFSTSFSLEDQLILDVIADNQLPIEVFTLDTGRLFSETYAVWSASREKYQDIEIKAFTPDFALLEPFIRAKGPNAFYESPANRKECCHIRKVEPLKRALAGKAVWITGLRAEHSGNRGGLEIVEWDDLNLVTKYHPLLHWTTKEVRKYIDDHDVPYNILHDRGFVSIGCAPCTRAIRPGEDFRAGRWWWESGNQKECGLHEKTSLKDIS
jgi:phosphoadenosine phosphosulfate reductase